MNSIDNYKNCIEAVEKGDVNTFLERYNIKGKFTSTKKLFKHLIETNNLLFVEAYAKRYPNGIRWRKILACELGSYDAFLILHQYNSNVGSIDIQTVVRYNAEKIFKYLEEHGYLESNLANCSYPEQYVVGKIAAKNGNLYMLRTLYDKGYPVNDRTVNIALETHKTSDRIEILQFLHDIVPNYPWGCKENKCICCNERKKVMSWNHWEMESSEYDSSIQWLPRETLDDTLSLMSV